MGSSGSIEGAEETVPSQKRGGRNAISWVDIENVGEEEGNVPSSSDISSVVRGTTKSS